MAETSKHKRSILERYCNRCKEEFKTEDKRRRLCESCHLIYKDNLSVKLETYAMKQARAKKRLAKEAGLTGSKRPAGQQAILGLQTEKQCLDLRVRGLSYNEIAERLGLSPKTPYFAVRRAFLRLREEVKESTEQVRDMELVRLDEALRLCWLAVGEATQVEDPLVRNRIRMAAVDRTLKIQQRRAALLGLDAPPVLGSVDLGKLSDEQIQRLAAGESVYDVLGSALPRSAEAESFDSANKVN